MHSFSETFFSVVLRPLGTMCEHFRDLWGKNTWNLVGSACMHVVVVA